MSWDDVAKYFPTKSTANVTKRWEKVLDPQLVRGSWTREEDARILEFVRTNGARQWSHLAAALRGRTSKQCRERFKHHLDPCVQRTPFTDSYTHSTGIIGVALHRSFQGGQTIASRTDGTAP
jgi:hypothetical protein